MRRNNPSSGARAAGTGPRRVGEPARRGDAFPPMTDGARLGYVDLFRGLLMAHMALDHASLFFNPHRWALEFASRPPPMDPPLAQFLTRFTGVFVAPGFSFIAGFMVAATSHAREDRGVVTTAVTRRLIVRGLVLIATDIALFSLARRRIELEVLSCLGASLIVLALLRHLPSPALALMALGIMGLHPLLDLSWMPDPLAWVLHEPHRAGRFRVWYPLIPWVGVMLLGYVVGRDAMTRAPVRRWLALAGTSLALFFLVRLAGGYGNAYPHQGLTSLDFWIFAKYPPDLAWLTLSFALIFSLLPLLSVLDGSSWRRWLEPLRTIGRVPFFFYVAHFLVLRALALAVPKLSLAATYVIWLALLGLMLGPCAWYFRLKMERPNIVTRYL